MAVVGILALQGDFAAHARAVERLGARPRAVKAKEHLEGLDALLLPGGESSTMLRLLQEGDLWQGLRAACRSGIPVLGTCAGAILLAARVRAPAQRSLEVLDIDVERNAYGRQIDSFMTTLDDGPPDLVPLQGVFIRAPVIRRAGPDVEVLVRHRGDPVLVRQGRLWAATFHPEMTDDGRLLATVLESAW